MSRTPHDEFFKEVFSIKEEAAAFLQRFLPRRVLRTIDLETLELQEGSFVDIRSGKKATDLLFKVRMRGQEVLIYLLLEHQSESDPTMPARLHIYVARIWARWLKDHPDAKSVPLVLPVVIHHGRKPWRWPTGLQEVVEVPRAWRPALAPFLPRLEWILVDLARIGDPALRRRIAGMRPFAAVALILLKRLRWEDPVVTLRPWKSVVRRLSREPESMAYWETLSEYILRVQPRVQSGVTARFLEDVAGTETGNMVMTTAEWLEKKGRRRGRAEGLAKGVAQGEAQGEARGEAKGLRIGLHDLLQARFGRVPESIQAKIDAAGPETLRAWIARAAKARSIRTALSR